MTTWDNETLTHHRCEPCQLVTAHQWPAGFKDALADGPIYTQCSKCFHVLITDGFRKSWWAMNEHGTGLVPMEHTPFYTELRQHNLPTRAADKYDSLQEFWETSISYNAMLELLGAMLAQLDSKGCTTFKHQAVNFSRILAIKGIGFIESFELVTRTQTYIGMMDKWLASQGRIEPPWGENPLWSFTQSEYALGGQFAYDCIRTIQHPTLISVAAQCLHERWARRTIPTNFRLTITDGEVIAVHAEINHWMLKAIRQSVPDIMPIWATIKLLQP